MRWEHDIRENVNHITNLYGLHNKTPQQMMFILAENKYYEPAKCKMILEGKDLKSPL
jgi:hypothetical protein